MHSWNCPSRYEAERRARDDASADMRYGHRFDYRSPYDCDEGNRSYQDEYRRAADRIEEEQAEERRAERRQEEEYWVQQAEEEARQRAEEEAYWAEQEEAVHFATLTPEESA